MTSHGGHYLYRSHILALAVMAALRRAGGPCVVKQTPTNTSGKRGRHDRTDDTSKPTKSAPHNLGMPFLPYLPAAQYNQGQLQTNASETRHASNFSRSATHPLKQKIYQLQKYITTKRQNTFRPTSRAHGIAQPRVPVRWPNEMEEQCIQFLLENRGNAIQAGI